MQLLFILIDENSLAHFLKAVKDGECVGKNWG